MKYIFTCFILINSILSFGATYIWNQNVANNWTTAANWTPARNAPAVNDELIFDGAVTPNPIVNFMPATQTIGKLSVINNANLILGVSANSTITIGNGGLGAPHFAVQAGSTLRFNSASPNTLNLNIGATFTGLVGGNVIFSAGSHALTAASASGLTFQNGATCTATGTYTGTPFGAGTANSVVFQAGSKYTHEASAASNPFQLTAPLSVIVFQKGSTYVHRVTQIFSASGRTYANFELDITGSLTISTGNSPWRVDTFTMKSGTTFNYNAAGGMAVGGDFKVNPGSVVYFTPVAVASTILFDGNVTQNVSGVINFSSSPSNGTSSIAVASSAKVNMLTSFSLLDSCFVHGKLYMNNQSVGGNGLNMYPDNTVGTASGTAAAANTNILSSPVNWERLRVGVKVTGVGIPNDTYVMKVSISNIQLSRFVTNAGTYTLQPVFNIATLGIGSPQGITAAGSSLGNVVSQVRNFQSKGNYEYTGGLAQRSGTGLPATVKNLILNQTVTDEVVLVNPVTVDDTFSLQRGLLTTDATAIITLRDTTAVSSPVNFYGFANEGHANSYVKGPMNIIASSPGTKIAPVGKVARFAPVRLNKINSGAVTYNLEYISSPYSDIVTDTLPLDHVSQVEHWLISANTTGPVVSAYLTLSWTPFSEVGDGNAANDASALNDLVVAHYINDGAGLKWKIDGADATTMPKNPGATVNYGMVTTNLVTGSFSPFTLGTKSLFNILPLRMISFDAIPAVYNVKISWSVEGEENTKAYQLERSANGINYYPVQHFNARGLASSDYVYSDSKYSKGWNYYRLRVLDKRGGFTYSRTVKAWMGESDNILVYPNPVTENIVVNLPDSRSTSNLQVVNSSGQVLRNLETSDRTIIMNLADLPAGNYYMKVRNNLKTTAKKFIKR